MNKSLAIFRVKVSCFDHPTALGGLLRPSHAVQQCVVDVVVVVLAVPPVPDRHQAAQVVSVTTVRPVGLVLFVHVQVVVVVQRLELLVDLVWKKKRIFFEIRFTNLSARFIFPKNKLTSSGSAYSLGNVLELFGVVLVPGVGLLGVGPDDVPAQLARVEQHGRFRHQIHPRRIFL